MVKKVQGDCIEEETAAEDEMTESGEAESVGREGGLSGEHFWLGGFDESLNSGPRFLSRDGRFVDFDKGTSSILRLSSGLHPAVRADIDDGEGAFLGNMLELFSKIDSGVCVVYVGGAALVV